MRKLYRKYIKRKVFAATRFYGWDTTKQCMDFVLNAPMKEWRSRLSVVRRSVGYIPVKKMKSLFLFLNE